MSLIDDSVSNWRHFRRYHMIDDPEIDRISDMEYERDLAQQDEEDRA